MRDGLLQPVGQGHDVSRAGRAEWAYGRSGWRPRTAHIRQPWIGLTQPASPACRGIRSRMTTDPDHLH